MRYLTESKWQICEEGTYYWIGVSQRCLDISQDCVKGRWIDLKEKNERIKHLTERKGSLGSDFGIEVSAMVEKGNLGEQNDGRNCIGRKYVRLAVDI